MKHEDKELLLKDLCARLPYGVNCEGFYYEESDYKTPYEHIETCEGHVDGIDHIGFDDEEIYIIIEGIPCELFNVKLYLRPMSSMTEEESKEFAMLQTDFYSNGWLYPIAAVNMVNWLNKNHFDYRGLIEKGLALEAPDGMYEINKK